VVTIFRHRELEVAASANGRLDENRTAMPLDDSFGDGKPDAGCLQFVSRF